MSWGYKITLFYLTFVVGIILLAVLCFQESINLETENYYEAELAYGSKMEKLKKGNAYKPLIHFIQTKGGIELHYPQNFIKNPTLKGTVTFFRPSNPDLDLTLELSPDSAGNMFVENSKVPHGFWKLNTEWTMNGNDYIIEDTLTIH